MQTKLYFDNSTTSKPSDKAIAKMLPFLTDHWGVPSAPHQMGQELFPAMEKAYAQIYGLFGIKDGYKFVFTSSSAEAVNQVFTSTYNSVTDPTGKNQYIITAIDEAASLMAATRLETFGCVIKTLRPDHFGKIQKEQIADAITPRTALVSISFANGLTGVINEVHEIAELCAKRGILLHLDMTHAIGKVYFDLEEINPAFITFSGDLLHAPQGTGGLFIQEGVKCSSLILGGQEQVGLRAGNFSVGLLAALGEAAEETLDASDYVCTEIARLKTKLENEILKHVKNVTIFFVNSEKLPHVSAIGFSGISNELLLYHLNKKGLFASIGGGSFQKINLLLEASSIDKKIAREAISFSLSKYTTEEEIDLAVKIIADCVDDLKKLSLNMD